MIFGIPYAGSKNIYAKDVVSALPAGNRLVDLFAGGCAISDCALNCFPDKYNSVLINDIDRRPIDLYWKCVHGKNPVPYNWISRKRFKLSNWATRLVWSFGCNMNSYLYGVDIEDEKHDIERWIVEGDIHKNSGILLTIDLPKLHSMHERYAWWKSHRKEFNLGDRLKQLERLERLERMERMERLERSSVPYWDYRYMIGDVVYCDIPYKQTCCKQYGERQFNHDAFWQWASTRFFDVYVSERTVPDYAEILLNRSVPSRASNKGVDKKVAEYLVRVGGRKCQSKQ